MTPQAVEVIKLADRLVKDMDNDIGKIHQHPMAAVGSFHGERLDAGVSAILFQSLSDALHLTVGATRANDEVVGNGSKLAHLQHDKVAGFLVERGTGQEQGFFPGAEIFQNFTTSGLGRRVYGA